MNVFLYRVIIIFFGVLHSMSMHSMMKTTLSRTTRTAKNPQTRSYFTPQAMHNINKPIKKTQLEKFNLAHGLALIESQTLPNLYDAVKMYTGTSKDIPVLFQLIKKMFHRVIAGGEIAITKNVANVPTFITPTIMGILIGSIESGEIEKGRLAFNIAITGIWQDDPEVERHRNGLDNAKESKKYDNKFKKDIDVFFDLAVAQSQENKDALYSILLAFLYKRIHHLDQDEEFHDWIDFLISLNQYIPVFSDEELDSVRKKLLQSGDTPSFIESTMFTVKSKVLNPKIVSSGTYTQFLTNNFPLVVSDIIERARKQSIYPPVVISGVFGYQGQPKKADCVETATRDILLNLFYDSVKKYFDVSKYPDLSITPELKEYLAVCNPMNMNTVSMGQLFFDMVSGRKPAIQYTGGGNYEMISTERNILTLLNALLGIQAVSWDDLGEILTKASNDAIEITCSKKMKLDKFTIDISIFDKKNSIKRYLTLNVEPRHSYVGFPHDQEIKKNINLQYLLQQDSINPQIKSIFYLNPNVTLKLSEQQIECFGPLLYCSWPVRTQDEKIVAIKKIIQGDSQDADAIQYAYGLFKSLDPLRMDFLLNANLLIAYCNDKDEKFINNTRDVFLKEVGLVEVLSNLLEKMPFDDAQKLLLSIMNEDLFKAELIRNQDSLWDPLDTKEGNGLLAYIVKNNLVPSDAESRNILMQQILDRLSNNNFMQAFYAKYPLILDPLLDLSMKLAESVNDKRNVCHFILHQNINKMDPEFHLYFYKKIFTLYIWLLNKNYFENIKILGDIRPRLKQGSEEYALYNKAMNEAEAKAKIERE